MIASRAIVLALGMLLAGCQRSAPPPAPPASPTATAPLPAPASNRIARLELGNAVDAQGRVVLPLIRFAPHDTFYASIELQLADAIPHTLDAHWFYLDTRQTILEERKLLTGPGPRQTVFQLSKPDGWPPGQYRLELRLDGQLAQARVFEVAAAAP
ncbi:hypothetical protein LJB71_01800 [Thermomonas sp. S9]|uniref:hypothetical protein n=1 Tax=Thermomonas sp. S9 TaxID=2885203 RepID=UPI00216B5144|nr:hypothetical protein [Thermomonas sp. S9]MCR6495104.1 hypothetical protein [Thermomonas sp. S9]